jgi:transcriptional regulator with XRE-family HTH domain
MSKKDGDQKKVEVKFDYAERDNEGLVDRSKSTFIPRSVSVIDQVIANNIKTIRLMFGLSQEKIAEYLNISAQQVQKYESCVNRISSSSLWILAEAIGISISTFFSGLRSSGNETYFISKMLSKQESFSLKEKSNEIDYTKIMKDKFGKIENSGIDKNILLILKAYNNINDDKNKALIADTIVALSESMAKKNKNNN